MKTSKKKVGLIKLVRKGRTEKSSLTRVWFQNYLSAALIQRLIAWFQTLFFIKVLLDSGQSAVSVLSFLSLLHFQPGEWNACEDSNRRGEEQSREGGAQRSAASPECRECLHYTREQHTQGDGGTKTTKISFQFYVIFEDPAQNLV